MMHLTSFTGVMGVAVKALSIGGELAGFRLIVTRESVVLETGTFDITFDMWASPTPPPGCGVDSVLSRLCSGAADALGRDDVARAIWAPRPTVNQNVEPDTFDTAPMTGDLFEAWDSVLKFWRTLHFDPTSACGAGWRCSITGEWYGSDTNRLTHWRPIVPPLPFREE